MPVKHGGLPRALRAIWTYAGLKKYVEAAPADTKLLHGDHLAAEFLAMVPASLPTNANRCEHPDVDTRSQPYFRRDAARP